MSYYRMTSNAVNMIVLVIKRQTLDNISDKEEVSILSNITKENSKEEHIKDINNNKLKEELKMNNKQNIVEQEKEYYLSIIYLI